MTKNNNPKNPAKDRADDGELYLAPPPLNGRIIGLDCHPDTFTAAVFEGTTPHDARQLQCRADLTLEKLLAWVAKEFTGEDLFLMEAGSNSFEICRLLGERGLRAVVLESAFVGKHAKSYADNDKLAAARIVRVYLGAKVPCVWVPDARTRERRELLHAYRKAVEGHVAAGNALKGYLNQFTVRPGKGDPALPRTRRKILESREWTPLQRELLESAFDEVLHRKERRAHFTRLIAREVSLEPLMLRCMKLLGIGTINAFAILAVVGDVKRFARPEKLVAYLGLNPGQRESGKGKNIRLGMGKRGRGDLRHLLIQGAQSVLRAGRATKLGQWGWKLFARKGQRNIAVAAIARKLAVQIWHQLSGNAPEQLEPDKSLKTKLNKLSVALGKSLRQSLAMPARLDACVEYLHAKLLSNPAQINTA